MPTQKYFTIVGSVLLVLLFVLNAVFDDEADVANPNSSLVVRQAQGTKELRLTEDVTPSDRIKETFAMFVPGDARRMREEARPFAKVLKPAASG